MKKRIIIFITFLIILLFSQVSLAYFSDNRNIKNNRFFVGILDFSLKEGIFLNNLTPQQDGQLSLGIQNQGNLSFQYDIKVEGLSGELCQYLDLRSRLNNQDINWWYPLKNFSCHVSEASLLENWFFEFRLNDTNQARQQKECYLKFEVEAWQTNVNSKEKGFNKKEEIIKVISSGTWQTGVFLNEFLPNPDGFEQNSGFDFGQDSDKMPQGEWIELYNNSNHPINITGWYFKDAADHLIPITEENTYPASTIVHGYSWLVVFMNGSVLNNSSSGGQPADIIYLYDNAHNIKDSYEYFGTNCENQPTPGEDNPPIPPSECHTILSVPGNKSYARIPDGEGRWYDPFPTPGFANATSTKKATLKTLNTLNKLKLNSVSTTKLEFRNATSNNL